MKDDTNNRKDSRRDSIQKKKFLDKSQKFNDEIPDINQKKQFKKRKQEIDEEEWEDWDRYYNH